MTEQRSSNYFGITDYIVVASTLLFSLLIGIYYAVIKKQTNEELLVGKRSMSTLPIAASMLVTYVSANSILGFTSEVMYSGSEIIMTAISTSLVTPFSIYCFVHVMYNLKLTSAFKYLELRFESPWIKWASGFLFIIQTVFVTGVMLYVPSIAMQTILGIPTWLSILTIGTCATVYTSIGGFQAVVLTDVFQYVLILVGMISVILRGFYLAGGISELFSLANEKGRLNLINLNFDVFQRHNVFNFIFGWGLMMFTYMGTNQSQVQRYSSLPTLRLAVKSVLLSIPLAILNGGLILLVGLALFATYGNCDPLLSGDIKRREEILPYFVREQLQFIPGMLGLFIACIFSAVLSSISSALNSLAAVTWSDFLSGVPFFKDMGLNGQAQTSRLTSTFYGIAVTIFAYLAQNLGSVVPLFISIVGVTSGPLGAVFIMGIFMPIINKNGAIYGLVTGFLITSFIAIRAFSIMPLITNTSLPTSKDGCQNESSFEAYAFTTGGNNTTNLSSIDWPQKIFTVSYLLYTTIGTLITIIVGILVSILSRDPKDIPSQYLHPILTKKKEVTENIILQKPYQSEKTFQSPEPPKASFPKSWNPSPDIQNGFSSPRPSII